MELHTQQQSGVKLDENGEEIIEEGICNRSGVYLEFSMRALGASVVSLLGGLIAIPIAIIMAKAAVKSFVLYLTKRSIHYHQAYPNCCGVKTWVIPLDYITSIDPVGTNDIWIYMEKNRVAEFLGGSLQSTLFGTPSYLILNNVKNNEEFVQAVKRELDTSSD